MYLEFRELLAVAARLEMRVALRKAKSGCTFSEISQVRRVFGHLWLKWIVMFLLNSNTIIIVDFKYHNGLFGHRSV